MLLLLTSLLILSLLCVAVSVSIAKSTVKPHVREIIIAGGGPSGLLCAHSLLSNPNLKHCNVKIIESKDDYRTEMRPGVRAYSLGLNIRGQTAIKHFDTVNRSNGLMDAIRKEGVLSDSFFLHIGKMKLHIRKPVPQNKYKPDDPPPTLLIPRNKLCGALLNQLNTTYGNDGRLTIDFQKKVTNVLLDKRILVTDDGVEHPYDLLVGGDGVGSITRQIMAEYRSNDTSSSSSSFVTEEVTLPGSYKVMLLNNSLPSLDDKSIHLLENTNKNKTGFNLFLIPAPGGQTCALVAWSGKTPIPSVLTIDDNNSSNIKSIKETIMSEFPMIGDISDASIEQLLQQAPSSALTVRCNRYHDSQGRILLLGDAAHSTGGTLGQGGNSALMDCVAFDKCLDQSQGDIDEALVMFSRKQVKEGLALWQLLQLASLRSPFKQLYSLVQLLKGVLHRFFPKSVQPPTQTALSQSLIPFSDIVRSNRFFVDKAIGKHSSIEPLV